jgi:Phage terminase large subunit (GpA)
MTVFASTTKKAAERPPIRAKTEREKQAERMRESRSLFRDVSIPWPADLRRRRRLEKDDAAWLRWYFHEEFTCEFTEQQREMIETISRAIRHRDDQALAASRGEGKTKISEACISKAVLTGVVSFALFCAANGSKAADSLQAIKEALETNDRLLADYPEVCVPIRALENTPNRAHYQTVSGQRMDNRKWYTATASKFSWCGDEIVLPNVPGSPSRGAIIATRGLDAEVRGINKHKKRVDVVLIDDPDTEESVNNPNQAVKLENRIDGGIAFLGSQKRGMARVLITTLQRRECVSAKFTDPKRKPTWKGRRFRFMSKPPERLDLWMEYIGLRDDDMQTGDEHARRSHAFYVERRAEMDRGAVVSNPNRFDESLLPDGTHKEISALQHYYNEVQRVGQERVSTELDNDPPEESALQESSLTAARIQRQTNGFERGIVPRGCTFLTQGMDVRKVAMHWVVRGWKLDEYGCLVSGHTIDYGIQDVWGTKAGSDEGVDKAIIRAVQARAVQMEETPYRDEDGQPVPIGMTLIDSGWQTEAVYAACRQLGLGWLPSKGFGKSPGCAAPSFTPPLRSTADKKTGDRWFRQRQPNGIFLVCIDADYWKNWEHDRWLCDPDKNGAMLLFGPLPQDDSYGRTNRQLHTAYSHHIVAEMEVEDLVKGILKRFWRVKPGHGANHYLDASTLADVAASMKGMQITKKPTPPSGTAGNWFAAQKRR